MRLLVVVVSSWRLIPRSLFLALAAARCGAGARAPAVSDLEQPLLPWTPAIAAGFALLELAAGAFQRSTRAPASYCTPRAAEPCSSYPAPAYLHYVSRWAAHHSARALPPRGGVRAATTGSSSCAPAASALTSLPRPPTRTQH